MKKRLDLTSLVMIILFAVIVIGTIAVVAIVSKNSSQNLQNELPPVHGEAQTVKYSTPEEIAEAFKTVCANGDIDGLYDLYYDDYLTKLRENMEDAPTKESFDYNILNEMYSVSGVDITNYGDIEMPATRSPASYANYIYARTNNDKPLPLTEEQVEDCANLTVYVGAYQTNHFVVKVDGAWYFIV